MAYYDGSWIMNVRRAVAFVSKNGRCLQPATLAAAILTRIINSKVELVIHVRTILLERLRVYQ